MGARNCQHFTKSDVEGLPTKETTYRIQDDGARGLCIQVTPAGVKSWVLRYRPEGRRADTMMTLGRFPELGVDPARKKAISALNRIQDGEDPNQTRQEERKALTLKELAEKFIKDHILLKNKTSTAKHHIRLVNLIIVPALGHKVAKDITPGDISTLLLRLGKHTPTQANRVRSVLSKMFNAAEMWSVRPRNTNPVTGQARNPETKKERNLSDRELVALGETLREIDAAFAAGAPLRPDGPGLESPFPIGAIKLALLTGMRKGEMIGNEDMGIAPMDWSEVDLKAGIITIPASRHKTGRKAGVRIIHLCAEARRVLEALPRPLGSNWVFPGNRPGRPLVNLGKVFYRIQAHVAAAQLKKPVAERVDISDVTIHDLRRTFGSVGARLGVPELFISALLGHAAGTVTQVYARVNGDPLQQAAENIGAHIHGLMSGTPALKEGEMAGTNGRKLNRRGKAG